MSQDIQLSSVLWFQSMRHEATLGATQVLIVAGEASGDTYAAELVIALRQKGNEPRLSFFGCGGDRMRRAGVETIVDIRKLAVLGPLEVLSHLWHLYTALDALAREARKRRPFLAILVDFPDFNLRLARHLKAMGIPIIYFISPQLWAWRSGRVRQIKALIDRMIVILPFEKEFYAKLDMEVDYVGHPLVDRVSPTQSRKDFVEKHGLDSANPIISLLPGSRTKEVKFHLPILLETARNLAAESSVQFVVPLASTVSYNLVESIWQGEAPLLGLKIIEGETYDAVASSDLAVVASGTATLETALLGTPLIAVFRISNLTWIIGQYLVNVPHYCLVNLIAGKRLVAELYQNDFTPQQLYQEIKRLLEDSALRNNVRIELSQLRWRLGGGGAIEKAAGKIWEWVQAQYRSSGSGA